MGKKYATNSTSHDWMFAPRSPRPVRPRRFLVPKPARVREARMQNWDDNQAGQAIALVRRARYGPQATFGELFLSSDVDARMQRQMI